MPTTTGRATDFITFSRTSNATVTASDGKIKWAGHNLALNSAAPVTQSITVIVGAVYKVEMTGSGSVALSGAGTGTATAGSPATVTATTTTLTLTVSGTVSTMWAYRNDLGGMVANPATGTSYYATTAAAYYAPRLDYDPVTLAAKGLLVEEQRTNFVLYSAAFDNAAWLKTNITLTPNAATAPNGTLTAYKVDFTSSISARIECSLSGIATVQHTASVWMRADMGTAAVQLKLANPSAITDVTLTTQWQRVTLVSTFNASTTYFSIENGDDGTAKTIYIWGAQLEAGSFATSYIPTGSATATRNADVASVATSAFPYSATEGTLIVSATLFAGGGTGSLASLTDGTNANAIGISATTIAAAAGVRAASVGQADLYDLSSASSVKVGVVWQANDVTYSAKGVMSSTPDTTVALPTLNVLKFPYFVHPGGSTWASSSWIKQITYIPRRLTNAELAARTA